MNSQSKTIISSIVLMFSLHIYSQKQMQAETINGTYHLFEAERGLGNKPTKTKLIEFGKHNDATLLAVAACAKCMPAVYTYKPEETKELGVNVFYNSMGLYVFQYDEESFIILMPNVSGEGDWSDFTYSNFYSKSEAKANTMTKKKIVAFVDKITE